MPHCSRCGSTPGPVDTYRTGGMSYALCQPCGRFVGRTLYGELLTAVCQQMRESGEVQVIPLACGECRPDLVGEARWTT